MKKTLKLSLIPALIMALILCLTAGIALSFRRQSVSAAVKHEFTELELQAANGNKTTVKYVNPAYGTGLDAFANVLFTGGHTSYISTGSETNSVAVLVEAQTGKVLQVLNQNLPEGGNPSFQLDAAKRVSTWITPTSAQYVIVGYGNAVNAPEQAGIRKFLAEQVKPNDVVKLLLDGTEASVSDVITATNRDEEFALTNYAFNNLKVSDADGNETAVNWVNPMPGKGTPSGQGVLLYTTGHTSYISDGSRKTSVAVLVDAQTMQVKKVYNKAGTSGVPAWQDDTWVYPKSNEFVLAAFSSGYGGEAEHTLRKFLAKDLEVGEKVTLKMDNQETTIADILKATQKTTTLEVETVSKTVTQSKITLSGTLFNPNPSNTYHVWLRHYDENTEVFEAEPVELALTQNKFSKEITLNLGVNYLEVYYTVNDGTEKLDKTTASVTYKEAEVNPYVIEGLEVESAPATQDMSAKGVLHEIRYVNPDFRNMEGEDYNYVVLFTAGHESFVTEGSRKTNTAILVDANTLTVKKVYNKAPSKGVVPSWSDDTCITPAEGEFVLLGVDSSYANAGHKKYIAENFNEGDKIKLLIKGEDTDIETLIEKSESQRTVSMKIVSEKGAFTTKESKYTVEGRFAFPENGVSYKVIVRKLDAKGVKVGEDIVIDPDGEYNFKKDITLSKGLNYIEITYSAGETETEKNKTVVSAYYKEDTQVAKEYVMWVDQFSSSINSKAHIESSMKKMKSAGVTAIALEVKGTEGYASYKKTTETNVPYYTETKNKQAAVASLDCDDTLEEVLKSAKKYGIKVYAAFNFLTEGVINGGDSAVLDEHPGWEEMVYAPEGKGEILSATDMAKLNSGTYILNYVNPANPEVIDFQLKRVKEVLENYDVDGIMMDRCRFDNRYADFSDISKEAFVKYLATVNKTLDRWPQDVYEIDKNGAMEPGKLYYDWYTFRASMIKAFADKLRETVDAYNTANGDDAILAAYVGNSYETMWQMGLNWASEDFTYTSSLGANFGGLAAMKKLYTAEYGKQSYLKDLDFLMVGTYGTSANSVKSYATLANIVTNCEIPVYASIDLGGNTDAAVQRQIIQTCIDVTEGCMLFSASSADMNKVKAAIADREYVKPETFSFYSSVLGNPLTVSKINTTRAANEYCYYDSQYGDKADANQTSVVVVVGADGRIVAVDNKEAVEIITGPTGQNTFKIPATKIPEGGFAIATPGGASIKSDPNDTRRTLAKLSVGDAFTAVYLTDYVKYADESFNESEIRFTFAAAILGSQEGVSVTVNGANATKGKAYTEAEEAPNGVYEYSAPVSLKYGNNTVKIEIKSGSTVIATQSVTVVSTKPTLERIIASDTMFKTEVGKSVNLGVTLYPVEAVETVTYESEDTSIATVDAQGNVTGVKAGKTKIAIKAGDKTLTVTVTVTGSEQSGGGCNSSLTGGLWFVLGAAALSLAFTVGMSIVVRRKKN